MRPPLLTISPNALRWPALSDFGRLSISEVGDGNLNLVFIVQNTANPAESVVLKQALPFLRVAGESWPLTRERMRYETQALLKYNELAPGLVPVVYDFDEEMSLVVMEHLKRHEIMRKSLVARMRFPKFVDHITTFLVNSLFFTSDLYLTGPEKKLLEAKFVNEQLRKLQEDFVYTNPYMASPENKWNPLVDDAVQAVRANAELKMAMAEMKQAYMTHAEALIHADLHTGSIMLNAEDTRIIDPEFAFFGPMAYDIGAVLQNLVLNYLSHFGHTPDREDARTLPELSPRHDPGTSGMNSPASSMRSGLPTTAASWCRSPTGIFQAARTLSPNTAGATSNAFCRKWPATAAPSSCGA